MRGPPLEERKDAGGPDGGERWRDAGSFPEGCGFPLPRKRRTEGSGFSPPEEGNDGGMRVPRAGKKDGGMRERKARTAGALREELRVPSEAKEGCGSPRAGPGC